MDPSASRSDTEQPPWLPAFLEHPTRPEEAPDRRRVLQVHQLWDEVLLDSRSLQPGQRLTVGEGWSWRWRVLGVDLGPAPSPVRRLLPWLLPGWSEVVACPVADLTNPDVPEVHDLFVPRADGWVARVAAHWPVRVEHSGRDWTLQDLIDAGAATRTGTVVEIPIRPDQRLAVRIGPLVTAAWTVLREAPAPRPGWMPDPGMLGALSAFSAAAAVLAGLVAFAPGTPQTSVLELEEQLVQLALRTPPPPPPQPLTAGDATSNSGGEAAPEPEPADPSEPPPSDEDIANSAGLMAALNAGAFGGMFDDGTLDTRLASAADGLIQAKGTGGPGGHGLDGRGDGLASGGSASGLCEGGPEDCAVRSRGPGYGGPGSGPGKTTGVLDGLVAGEPFTVGSLPASAVDEVVRSHLKAIRYCYQRQLQRSPGLAGKITVKFTIAGDGSVSDARILRGTLGDDAVQQCIVGRFMRMQFPEPAGNGIVVVSYPFLFQPS